MALIYFLLLFLLVIVLVVVVSVFGFLGAIFRFGRKNARKFQEESKTSDVNQSSKSKVFQKEEGEYVDFEDVDAKK